MVMVEEILLLTKRIITHFFSLIRTVSKNYYSCMLAISFSIDIKFSPLKTQVDFFLSRLDFGGYIISIRLWKLIIHQLTSIQKNLLWPINLRNLLCNT